MSSHSENLPFKFYETWIYEYISAASCTTLVQSASELSAYSLHLKDYMSNLLIILYTTEELVFS